MAGEASRGEVIAGDFKNNSIKSEIYKKCPTCDNFCNFRCSPFRSPRGRENGNVASMIVLLVLFLVVAGVVGYFAVGKE